MAIVLRDGGVSYEIYKDIVERLCDENESETVEMLSAKHCIPESIGFGISRSILAEQTIKVKRPREMYFMYTHLLKQDAVAVDEPRIVMVAEKFGMAPGLIVKSLLSNAVRYFRLPPNMSQEIIFEAKHTKKHSSKKTQKRPAGTGTGTIKHGKQLPTKQQSATTNEQPQHNQNTSASVSDGDGSELGKSNNLNCSNNKHYIAYVESMREKMLHDAISAYYYNASSGPLADQASKLSGVEFEWCLYQLLRQRGIHFITEDAQRLVEERSTPDVRFKKPTFLQGQPIYWIDSKFKFGSPMWYEKDNSQFQRYIRQIGPGLVVYWRGFVANGPEEPILNMLSTKGLFVSGSIPEDLTQLEE
eukprot:m.41970 g.41970  ORF g.41970 m.41970 type:complete len:359 (+) comp10478_c0_seq1:168-1244(+)